MRMVLQRALYAKVHVDGEVVSEIGQGIVALVGITDGDDDEKVMEYMLDKLLNLRIFEDSEDKLNLSVLDIDGGILLVPNFTIYGDARKGRRPSYSNAASPKDAEDIFKRLCQKARELPIKTGFGVFQADMRLELINDGPVTLLLSSDKLF